MSNGVPAIPNLPRRWDMLLFIMGCFFIALGIIQPNNWSILLGLAFLLPGLLIAGYPIFGEMYLDENSSDDDMRKFAMSFIGISILIFFLSLIIVGILLFR